MCCCYCCQNIIINAVVKSSMKHKKRLHSIVKCESTWCPCVTFYEHFNCTSYFWLHSCTGVLMWEIFTCGEMPYGRTKNPEVIDDICHHSKRLPKPAHCPDSIYVLMQSCWLAVCYLCLFILCVFSQWFNNTIAIAITTLWFKKSGSLRNFQITFTILTNIDNFLYRKSTKSLQCLHL